MFSDKKKCMSAPCKIFGPFSTKHAKMKVEIFFFPYSTFPKGEDQIPTVEAGTCWSVTNLRVWPHLSVWLFLLFLWVQLVLTPKENGPKHHQVPTLNCDSLLLLYISFPPATILLKKKIFWFFNKQCVIVSLCNIVLAWCAVSKITFKTLKLLIKSSALMC